MAERRYDAEGMVMDLTCEKCGKHWRRVPGIGTMLFALVDWEKFEVTGFKHTQCAADDKDDVELWMERQEILKEKEKKYAEDRNKPIENRNQFHLNLIVKAVRGGLTTPEEVAPRAGWSNPEAALHWMHRLTLGDKPALAEVGDGTFVCIEAARVRTTATGETEEARIIRIGEEIHKKGPAKPNEMNCIRILKAVKELGGKATAIEVAEADNISMKQDTVLVYMARMCYRFKAGRSPLLIKKDPETEEEKMERKKVGLPPPPFNFRDVFESLK